MLLWCKLSPIGLQVTAALGSNPEEQNWRGGKGERGAAEWWGSDWPLTLMTSLILKWPSQLCHQPTICSLTPPILFELNPQVFSPNHPKLSHSHIYTFECDREIFSRFTWGTNGWILRNCIHNRHRIRNANILCKIKVEKWILWICVFLVHLASVLSRDLVRCGPILLQTLAPLSVLSRYFAWGAPCFVFPSRLAFRLQLPLPPGVTQTAWVLWHSKLVCTAGLLEPVGWIRHSGEAMLLHSTWSRLILTVKV